MNRTLTLALLALVPVLVLACGDAERLRVGGSASKAAPAVDESPFSIDLEDRAAAKTGRRLFTKRGCATCHDVKGSRRLSGPSLAGIKDRRRPEEIRHWIRDPRSLRPETVMPPLPEDAGPQEAEFLTAYLLRLRAPVDPMAAALVKPVGGPPAPAVKLDDPAAIQAGFSTFRRLCLQCHPTDKAGVVSKHQLGLKDVGGRLGADELRRWVRDPAAIKPGTAMPAWRGNDTELERVVAFLLTLKG